jgi:hypothetical protein
MDKNGYKYAVPTIKGNSLKIKPIDFLTSNYIQKAIHQFPKNGDKKPWKVVQNYYYDMMELKYKKVNNKHIDFFK